MTLVKSKAFNPTTDACHVCIQYRGQLMPFPATVVLDKKHHFGYICSKCVHIMYALVYCTVLDCAVSQIFQSSCSLFHIVKCTYVYVCVHVQRRVSCGACFLLSVFMYVIACCFTSCVCLSFS